MKIIILKPIAAVKSQSLFWAFLMCAFGINGAQAQDSLINIIPDGSTLKTLSSNQFKFTEGPVWYQDSVLLFTDGDASPPKIYRYNPFENQFSTFLNNSHWCLGLACDMAGNLLACENRRVVMLNEAGGIKKQLASTYNGKPFNSTNDLIADSKGGVYFTDPLYSGTATQDKEAVYYIDSTGYVTRIIDDLIRPNGIVLSPDGARLYVVDSETNYVYSWNVAVDGSVSGKSVFAELRPVEGTLAGSDGMAVDINGNIYVATEKGVQVFSTEGGAIAIIELPEKTSNCDFGGPDFKTLYITARKNLYSIELNYEGFAVSRTTLSVGSNSIPGKPGVKLYPNPARDMLYLNPESGEFSSVEILNMAGKKQSIPLKKEDGSGIEISTQALKPGMYLVNIYYSQGVVSRKFVKE